MANYLSPGVYPREVDESLTVPMGATTAGAFVAPFLWGPINERVLITDDIQLERIFGKPTTENNTFWYSAYSFLAYTKTLWLVRAASAGVLNAVSEGTAIQIQNSDEWTINHSAGQSEVGPFAARYAGSMGNSIKISVCDAASFATWDYAFLFDSAPGTSDWALSRGGTNDEMHIVVIDELGAITDAPGTILNTFAYVSKASDVKYSDGTSAYYKNVIENQSNYIYWMDHLNAEFIGSTSNGTAFGNLGADPLASPDPILSASYTVTLSGGTDDFVGTDDAEYQMAWDLFDNKEEVDLFVVFTGPHSVVTKQYVLDNIAETRKDLIVTISPNSINDVRGTGIETKVVDGKDDDTTGINRNTSYGFYTCNWKLMFDRYNEVNVWVPDSADIAGLIVRTATDRDPWWSPAGEERGRLKNVIRLAWNPNQTQRDILYKAQINAVVNLSGTGPILFGDKTMLNRESAFSRINVRMLFIYLRKNISTFSRSVLFEFNDEFTRAQYINAVTPFMRDVQGRRGCYSFQVIADESVNTPTVIDANIFKANIRVAPTRSINFVDLVLTATKTGATVEEA